MNKTFKFLPLVAASAVLAGCQDYDLGFDAKEIAYKQSFEKAFGKVDPNQNWDLYGQLMAGENGSTRAATTAPLLGSVDISDLPEEQYAYLTKEQAERYKNMLPESEADALDYDKTNLGRVVQNFKVKTKSFVVYPVHWNTTGSDVVGFYYYVPEGTTGAEKVYDIDGKPYYICKVKFYDNKTHLFYTTNDEYGYSGWAAPALSRVLSFWDQLVNLNSERYIEDNDQKKVIASSDGNAYPLNADFAYYPYSEDLWEDLVSIDPVSFFLSDGTYKDMYGNTITLNGKVVGMPIDRVWKDVGGDNDARTTKDALSVWTAGVPAKMLQSRGIIVTLPETASIGMYLTNGSHTFYSESKLNEKTDWGGTIGAKESCFVATYLDTDGDGNPVVDKDGNQVRYLCFEDWYGVKNFDLNDIVFRVYGFDGPGSEVVDEDSYTEEALLVCEDLGDDDFDFNDVVLKLSYQNAITRVTHYKPNSDEVDHVDMTNNESIKVTAMAAGGANESTVTIHPAGADDASNDYQWGEIHALLNGSAPSIINADPEFGGEGQSLALPVATYGATWNKAVYPTYLSMLYDKGFIKITSSGENAKAITSTNSYSESGEVPQMMLLPVNFEWPQERTYIVDAYSEFKNWVGDASATSWINTRDRSKVTKRNVIVTPSEPELPSVPEPVEPSDNDGLVLTISSGLSMTFDNTTEPQSIIASCATDGATISFSSDNEDAATVTNDGVVTPIANGSATITVTVSCDGYESVSKDVTVTVSNYPVAYGTLITEKVTGTDFGMFVKKNDNGTYDLQSSDKSVTFAQNVSSITFVCVADGYMNIWYHNSDYSVDSSPRATDMVEIPFNGTMFDNTVNSDGYLYFRNNGGGKDFALYCK